MEQRCPGQTDRNITAQEKECPGCGELVEVFSDDEDEGCKAPDVFKRLDNTLLPTSEISYSTLPDMFNELTAGGNFSYFIDRRTHVGVTGYGADVTWLVEDIDLDFQVVFRADDVPIHVRVAAGVAQFAPYLAPLFPR